MTTARVLGAEIRQYATAQVDSLVADHLPGLRLPGSFGGHRVGADVRADLLYTLGMLYELGVAEVGGLPTTDAIITVLRPISGAATNTFFSYRVAETVARFGPFADHNPVLEPLSPAQRAEVAAACDSRDWISLLDERLLPRNYTAVLARCEVGRRRLGLDVDPEVVDSLLLRTRQLLGANPHGYLDDSEDGRSGRFDIYTADLYLFTEPFADQLGEQWTNGFDHAAELVAAMMAGNGAAITWGRSTGALAVCLSLEYAALALTRPGPSDPERWLARGQHAFEQFREWMHRGLVSAHQHRDPYRYRGPARRLQMSLDCLGKLTAAALLLEEADPTTTAVPWPEARDGHDELLSFDPGTTAGVWRHRSRQATVTVPITGTVWSDYLAAPQIPSRYEVPVDKPRACWLPTVFVADQVLTAGGLPRDISCEPGALTLRYDGFQRFGGIGGTGDATRGGPALAGDAEITYRVDGRRIDVSQRLRFTTVPDAVTVLVPEASGRPLRVEWDTPSVHASTVIDTSGMKEWRSFWSELPRVHQLDLEPARELSIDYSVVPLLRVASDQIDHHYHRSLYAPLADRVVETRFATGHVDRPDRADRLREVDVFHLHWPEWFTFGDLELGRRFVALLDRHDVALAWTQHNLQPHQPIKDQHDLYQLFADRADAVFHQSEWGRQQVEARYRFRPDAVHAVVGHGHWGGLLDSGTGDPIGQRAAAERELGLAPCELRLGIVGAPRHEKRTADFMHAFAASRRYDLQLLVLSLEGGEAVPDDERTTASPYEFVDRATYNRRLAAIDVLVLPIDPSGGLLATGVVGDVIGAGRPALVTPWPFLTELLGEAGIDMGATPDEWTATIDRLDPATVESAALAARRLRATLDWAAIAETHLAVLEQIVRPKD